MENVRKITRLGCALLLLAAAGLGCAAGRNEGETCAETADCRPELACFEGRCALPGCPSDAPVDCGSALPDKCCPISNPVCCARDGNCHADSTSCGGPTCSSVGKACVNSTTCCRGMGCGRFSHACQVAVGLAVGEPCTGNSQCGSRLCSDYCTKKCTKTSECGAANYCLETSQGFLCVPFCQGNADCTVFGAGITCQGAPDPAGLMLKGCFGK